MEPIALFFDTRKKKKEKRGKNDVSRIDYLLGSSSIKSAYRLKMAKTQRRFSTVELDETA